MFIRDFYEALDILTEALESDVSICIERITSSYFGETFQVYPNRNINECYQVNIKTRRVEYHYEDTWRHPEHRVIISEGI